MNICGIPIKQLNLVEDRADYYKHRHTAAQSALVQALQTLALLGDGAAAAPGSQPPLAPTPAVDLNNLAALLSLEGGAAQMQAPRPQVRVCCSAACRCGRSPAVRIVAAPAAQGPPPPPPRFPPPLRPVQPYPMHQASHSNYDPRFAPGPASLPFANLPGFTSASLTTGAASLAMAPAASPAAYMPAPVPQPAFPPASAAALAAALATPAPGCADWQLPAGASSPYSTLDAAHASASSSPPKSGELAQLAAAVQVRAAGGSASSGSTSPDLGAAAANRLAMWQLQNELLAGEGASALAPCCDWAPGALAATSNS